MNEEENINYDFTLKDKCIECNKKLICNYQETGLTRFVNNKMKIFGDSSNKYDGLFTPKCKIIKQKNDKGKIKYIGVCSECQKKGK